jgi:hypothetical protein
MPPTAFRNSAPWNNVERAILVDALQKAEKAVTESIPIQDENGKHRGLLELELEYIRKHIDRLNQAQEWEAKKMAEYASYAESVLASAEQVFKK